MAGMAVLMGKVKVSLEVEEEYTAPLINITGLGFWQV